MDRDPATASLTSHWDEAAERKMADLAAFANGLVHDIRNPLNVIRSNLYLLRQRMPEDDPRTTRALDRIDDQVTVALRLLDGVSAFYRADQPSLQRIQVNEVLKSVLPTITVTEGCTLESELADGLPLVQADPQLIEATLRALLRNALDAVAQGGTVRVCSGQENGCVTLSVEDTGEGLTPEAEQHAFEPMFSTRRARAGLGLALAAKIAAKHGGTVRLESRPGEGTRAVLNLPLAG